MKLRQFANDLVGFAALCLALMCFYGSILMIVALMLLLEMAPVILLIIFVLTKLLT